MEGEQTVATRNRIEQDRIEERHHIAWLLLSRGGQQSSDLDGRHSALTECVSAGRGAPWQSSYITVGHRALLYRGTSACRGTSWQSSYLHRRHTVAPGNLHFTDGRGESCLAVAAAVENRKLVALAAVSAQQNYTTVDSAQQAVRAVTH